eukprot:CAMPEP_0114973260 /NCGR_PEP_ID=MMETSP0216-20121206/857_1 /TAXON_ID=223996 /ORGANISM="Protocruzia adherens, Strain Boccale" /LENGTH=98 /DNA_ID=CAMNT_0002333735 /DNA_START=128 /DNA_END=424 /DNA_ORIENTATION=+
MRLRLLPLIILITLAVLPSVVFSQCDDDEFMCPAGCCPESEWVCCDEIVACAASLEDCPSWRRLLSEGTSKTYMKLNRPGDKSDNNGDASSAFLSQSP